MKNRIILLEAPIYDGDQEKSEYFKSLDFDSEYVNKCLNLLSKEGEYSVTDIYTSPYFSTLQLASKISSMVDVKFKIDNSLYDVLSKEKYEMHKCKYFWNDLIKHKNFKMDKTTNILGNKEYYYTSSILASNVKYAEDKIDILNRIAPFLFKIFDQFIMDDEDKNKDEHEDTDKKTKGLIMVTHSSIFPYVKEYLEFYQKTNIPGDKTEDFKIFTLKTIKTRKITFGEI